jgi:hypothetical protein
MKTISVKTAPVVSGDYKEKAIATAIVPSVIASANVPSQVAADRDMSLNIEVTPLPPQNPSDYVFREETFLSEEVLYNEIDKSCQDYPIIAELLSYNYIKVFEDTLNNFEAISLDSDIQTPNEDVNAEEFSSFAATKSSSDVLGNDESLFRDFYKSLKEDVVQEERLISDVVKPLEETSVIDDAIELHNSIHLQGDTSEFLEEKVFEILKELTESVLVNELYGSEKEGSFSASEDDLGFSETFTLDSSSNFILVSPILEFTEFVFDTFYSDDTSQEELIGIEFYKELYEEFSLSEFLTSELSEGLNGIYEPYLIVENLNLDISTFYAEDYTSDEAFHLDSEISIYDDVYYNDSLELLVDLNDLESLSVVETTQALLTPQDVYCNEDYFAEDYLESLPRFYNL